MVQIIFLAGHSEKHILGENATMEATVNSSSEEKGNQSIEAIGNAATTMKTTEAVQGLTGENDRIGNATTAPPHHHTHHQFDQQKHKHTKTTTADDSTLESENDNYKSNACRSKTIKEEIKHKRSNKTYTVWWCKKANGKKRQMKNDRAKAETIERSQIPEALQRKGGAHWGGPTGETTHTEKQGKAGNT